MAVTTTVADKHVFGGVDTHKDTHVAACLDSLGGLIATKAFPATRVGYEELLKWLSDHGAVEAVGVEGTGSWGAGLSRYLRANDICVFEVSRPNRQKRRLKGKSDTIDAEMAARAVLSADGLSTPKSNDSVVESIRMLRVVLRSAMNSRTQAANQIHSLIDTSPDSIRSKLHKQSIPKICAAASRFRIHQDACEPQDVCKASLRSLARRWLALSEEVVETKANIERLLTKTAPELLELVGVGVDTASAILVAVGDNPDRCRTEQGFASLCGVSPVDASSGRNQRHRLNRGGSRQANQALWRIVLVRLTCDPVTREYMARRQSEGKTKREAIRCLKRYVARQIWRTQINPQNTSLLLDSQ